jgi:hypothetical protein
MENHGRNLAGTISAMRRIACAVLIATGFLGAAGTAAAAATLTFTTQGTITQGSDHGAFGLGTPGAPFDLAGLSYTITQRFPLANATATTTSGPGFDDAWIYFDPGGSADITVNGITVTLSFGSVPTQNYFGLDNGFDPAAPLPAARDVVAGQQATYLTAGNTVFPIVLDFMQQIVVRLGANLFDAADPEAPFDATGLDATSSVTVWNYDYALSRFNFDFAGLPERAVLAVVATVPEPPALPLLAAGLAGLLAAGTLRRAPIPRRHAG